ncbi:dTDP-4-dehydrorhamnose reductase family protein [Paraburkholderia sp. SOS3]|uniref:dTDP-4-dehydrorhamnose reductase family protein n=1 Tax=Paraburkholderia sp. SOS3 TaxID=1926494 RepID=UPI0009477790|nr:SDR family oxidoreductase [Paraburkholderia sp. SOS3]APR36371.1 NAD(P)-dependent oxidoreductase [Paraburkholderia sp. SOS3]
MYKVALIGASGLLGRAVAQRLSQRNDWQVVQTAFAHAEAPQVVLDIRDENAITRFVDEQAPDAIVIAAAERRPDVCENDPALARALNVEAVRAIAGAARRHGAWVLSISTDYVFDGTRPPYRHDAPAAPINAYGRSKLEGERALFDATNNGCVLRLPLLYGPIVSWQESAVTSLVPAIAASASAAACPAVMDAWATRYPTFTPDVAIVIMQMLERHARGEPVCGITQWSGDEPMTKYDIACRLAKALELDAQSMPPQSMPPQSMPPQLTPPQLTPQYAPADATPRPRDCHLDSSVLEALGIGRRTPFDVAIRQVLADFPWRGAAA